MFSKTLVWSGPYSNGKPLNVPLPGSNASIILQARPPFRLVPVRYENRTNPATGRNYRFRVGSGL